MRNTGTGKEFYVIQTTSWKSCHIEDWLKHIYIQPPKQGITTVYEYLAKNNLLPKSTGIIWKTRDFTIFSYEKLIRYFTSETTHKDEYLEKVFGGVNKDVLLPAMKREVESLEANDLFFNYNMYAVLKKRIKKVLNLDVVISKLHLGDRYTWSVVDCVDHLLSMLFFREKFESVVYHSYLDFQDLEKVQRLDDKNMEEASGEKWDGWRKMLIRFNEDIGFELQKVCYEVWIKSMKMELQVKMLESYNELGRIDQKKEKPSSDDDEEEEEEEEEFGENEDDEDQSGFGFGSVRNNTMKKRMELLEEYQKCQKTLEKFENPSEEEEYLFKNSPDRRLYIQELLFQRLSAEARTGMAEIGVKLVLNLHPGMKSSKGEEVLMNLQKGAFKVMKTLWGKPKFSEFGFCHSSIMIMNLGIHWFSNSQVWIADRRVNLGYEEICAVEAGCPIILSGGNVKSVYHNIIQLAETIVDANVHKTYSFLNVRGEESRMNCQEFMLRMLKNMNYTDYNKEVKLYIDQFIDKYSQMGNEVGKVTKDSRWLTLNNVEFNKKFEGVISRFVLPKQKDKKKVFFNTHQSVDEFYYGCLDIDPDFKLNHYGVYQLLKAFDRAFWILNRIPGDNMVCPFGGLDSDLENRKDT